MPTLILHALDDLFIPMTPDTRAKLIADPRVMLVESHEAAAGFQVNTALELVVGDHAHVDHIKITGGADDLVHVSSLMASVGANAQASDTDLSADQHRST